MSVTDTAKDLSKLILKKLNSNPNVTYLEDLYVSDGQQSPFRYMNPFIAVRSPSTFMFLIRVVEIFIVKENQSMSKIAEILANIFLETATLVQMLNYVNKKLYTRGPRKSGVGRTLIDHTVGGSLGVEGDFRVNTVCAQKKQVVVTMDFIDIIRAMLKNTPLLDCTFAINGASYQLKNKSKVLKEVLL